ncbi:MAG: winged helix-turn-helix transcriptional regulator [Candidatus Hodarchaeales archaeon]|jgi:DNA-binding Lrp family transcriptional regulator
MSIELDQKDLTILERLNKDGRITYSQLGTELSLSIPSIRSRIEKLLKIGVIDYIGIHLNPHTLTSDNSAIISVKVDPKEKDQFTSFLSTLESVKSVYEVMDEYNVHIITQHVSFSDSEKLFEVLRQRSEVHSAKISFVTKEVFSKPHHIPKSTKLLNIQCEYCGKQIESTYETGRYENVPHYFCCRSCLKNYGDWRKSQIEGRRRQ